MAADDWIDAAINAADRRRRAFVEGNTGFTEALPPISGTTVVSWPPPPQSSPPPVLHPGLMSPTGGAERETPLALKVASEGETLPPPPMGPTPDAPTTPVSRDHGSPVAWSASVSPAQAAQAARIRDNAAEIYVLAICLERMARDGIEALRGLNDPVEVERNKSVLDLLTALADGLAKIASALEAFASDRQPVFLGRAAMIANALTEQLSVLWEASKSEATDFLVRFPVIAGAVQLLNMASADMHFATPMILAWVGGPKAIQAYQALRGKPAATKSE